MAISDDHNSPPSLSNMIFGDGTPKKAFFTALVVGTILTLINHGDVLLAGEVPPALKVILTFCVPYCVTTWGAVTGKRAQWRRDHLPMEAERVEAS
ncbi:MAG: nitrate/nitrite transporter NrtS [Hyphomicrobiales bacterium]